MPGWRWWGWLPAALLLLLHPFRASGKQPVTQPDYTLYHNAYAAESLGTAFLWWGRKHAAPPEAGPAVIPVDHGSLPTSPLPARSNSLSEDIIDIVKRCSSSMTVSCGLKGAHACMVGLGRGRGGGWHLPRPRTGSCLHRTGISHPLVSHSCSAVPSNPPPYSSRSLHRGSTPRTTAR